MHTDSGGLLTEVRTMLHVFGWLGFSVYCRVVFET